MKNFLKGLFLFLIAFVATFVQAKGVPSDWVHTEALLIAVMCSALGYLGQSVLIPTTSLIGTINLRDFLKGLIIAVINFGSTFGAEKLTGTFVDVKTIVIGTFYIIIGYAVKQLSTAFTPPTL